MVDNATYEKVVPPNYANVLVPKERQPNEKKIESTDSNTRSLAKKLVPNTKTIVSIDSEGNEHRISYHACYPKARGRYSISPAMVVVLTTLMSNAFEENFSNIGDVFEREMAKFLFFIVQAFHGRPVRELVDFIVGPSAFVGKTAQKILKRNTTVAFDSVALRIAGADKNHVNLWTSGDGASSHAWIEISPPGLGSADIVLHIPKVITIPIQCKDVGNPFSYHEIAKALNSMLVNSNRWKNPDQSKEYAGGHNDYAQALQAVEIAFSDAQQGDITIPEGTVTPSAAAIRLQAPATGNIGASPEKKAVDFGQKLQDLGAPVIPVLYMSRALAFDSAATKKRQAALSENARKRGKLTWDHLNAIGPHCIMAEGIGEHSLDTPYHVFDDSSPVLERSQHSEISLTDTRLHSARRSVMVFEFRQKTTADVVGLAAASPAPVPATIGKYSVGQCIVLSEKLRCHFASAMSDSKDLAKANLKLEEDLRLNREFLVEDFKRKSEPSKAEKAKKRIIKRMDVAESR